MSSKQDDHKQTKSDSSILNITLHSPDNTATLSTSSAPSTPIQPIQLTFPETNENKQSQNRPASPASSSSRPTSKHSLSPLQTTSLAHTVQLHHANDNDHPKRILPELSLFLPFKPHFANAFATMIDTDLLYIVTSSSMILISTLYELTHKESRTLNKRYSSIKIPRVYALCVEMVPRQDLLSKPLLIGPSATHSTSTETTTDKAQSASSQPTNSTSSHDDVHPDHVLKDTPESLYSDPKKPDIPITPNMYHLFIPTVTLRIYSSFPMNQTQWRNPVEIIKLSPPAFLMKPQHIAHSQMLSERSQKAATAAAAAAAAQQNLTNTASTTPLTPEEKQLRHIESLIWCEELQPPVVGSNQQGYYLQHPTVADAHSKPFYAFQLPLTTTGGVTNPPTNTTAGAPAVTQQPQPVQSVPGIPLNQSQTEQTANSAANANQTPSLTAASPFFGSMSAGQPESTTKQPPSASLTVNTGSQSTSFSAQPSPSRLSTSSTTFSSTMNPTLEPSQFSLNSTTDSTISQPATSQAGDSAKAIGEGTEHSTNEAPKSSKPAVDDSNALSLDTFFEDAKNNTPDVQQSRQVSADDPTQAVSDNNHIGAQNDTKFSQNQSKQQQQPQQPQQPQLQPSQQPTPQKPAKTDFFTATWGAFTKSITPTPAKPTVQTVTSSTPAQGATQPGNPINQRFLCSMNPIVSRCWVYSLNWVCDAINDHLAKYNLAARGRKRGETHLPYPAPINFLSFPVPNEPLLNIYSFPPCQSMTSPYHPDRKKDELENKDKKAADQQGSTPNKQQDNNINNNNSKTQSFPTTQPSTAHPATSPSKDLSTAQSTSTSTPTPVQTPLQTATVSTTSPIVSADNSSAFPPSSNNASTSQFSAISLNSAQPVLVYNNLGQIVKMNREVDYTHLFQPTLSVVHTTTSDIVPVYSDLINFERFITEVQNQIKLSQPDTPIHHEPHLRSTVSTPSPDQITQPDDKVEDKKPLQIDPAAENPTPVSPPLTNSTGDNWFTKMFKASTYTGKPAQTPANVTPEPKTETPETKLDTSETGQNTQSIAATEDTEPAHVPYNVIHPKSPLLSSILPTQSYLGLQAIQQTPPFQHHPPVHPMHLMKEITLPLSLKQFYYLCLDNTAPISMNAFHTSLPEQFFQVKTGEWSVCTPSVVVNETTCKANHITPTPYSLQSVQKSRDEPISLPTTQFQRAIGHTIPPINIPVNSTPSSPFTPSAVSWDVSTPEDNLTSLLTSLGANGAVTLTPAELYNMAKETGYIPQWKQYLFRTISMKSRVSTPTGIVETRLLKTQRLAAFYATINGKPEIVGFELETCSSTPDVKFGDCFVVVDSTLAFSSKVLEAAGVGGAVPSAISSSLYCDVPSMHLITRSNVKFVQSSWAMKAFTGIINSRSRSDNAVIVGQYYEFLEQRIPHVKSFEDGKILTTIDKEMMWPPVVYQSNARAVAGAKETVETTAAATEAEAVESLADTQAIGPDNEHIFENTLKLVDLPPQLHPLFVLPVCLFGLPILSLLTGQGFTIPTNLVLCIVIAVVMLQVVSVQKDLITVKRQQKEILTLLQQQQQQQQQPAAKK